MNDPYESIDTYCVKCEVRLEDQNTSEASVAMGLCSSCHAIAVSDDPDLLLPHLREIKSILMRMDQRSSSGMDHFSVIEKYLNGMVLSEPI